MSCIRPRELGIVCIKVIWHKYQQLLPLQPSTKPIGDIFLENKACGNSLNNYNSQIYFHHANGIYLVMSSLTLRNSRNLATKSILREVNKCLTRGKLVIPCFQGSHLKVTSRCNSRVYRGGHVPCFSFHNSWVRSLTFIVLSFGAAMEQYPNRCAAIEPKILAANRHDLQCARLTACSVVYIMF